MIIEHARNAQYLSNTYLVCDRDGGSAVVIDAGGPLEPVFKAADSLAVTPSMVLLTHHHHDHVSEVPGLAARWPGSTERIKQWVERAHERPAYKRAEERGGKSEVF